MRVRFPKAHWLKRKASSEHDEMIKWSMAYVLREPQSNVEKIFTSWRTWVEDSYQIWEDARSTTLNQDLEQASELRFTDEELLLAYLNRLPSGIMLAPIHMGLYLHAVLRILVQMKGRKVLLLRPGMLVSSDLILKNRTLNDWVLEPLYAIDGKQVN